MASSSDDRNRAAHRRRSRNLALLAVLLALSGLFFAITLAKLSGGRPHRPVSWSAPAARPDAAA